MTTAQMIKDAIARALAAVRLPFRAVLGGLNGKPGVQLAQGDALNGEKLEASEVFQQFGFICSALINMRSRMSKMYFRLSGKRLMR